MRFFRIPSFSALSIFFYQKNKKTIGKGTYPGVRVKFLYLILSAMIFLSAFPGVDKTIADELVIGTSTGYPPYYFNADGKLKGLCIDIINEVANTLGRRVRYEQYPWKRMLLYAKTGKVDAIMPLFRTPERETFLYFYDNELAIEENQLFIKKGRQIKYNGNLSELKPYRIGVVDNYSYGADFDHADYLNKMAVKNEYHLLKLIAFDMLDIGIGNHFIIRYNPKVKNVLDKVVFLNPPITKEYLYLGFSKASASTEEAKTFSNALVKLKQTSLYNDLMQKYDLK